MKTDYTVAPTTVLGSLYGIRVHFGSPEVLAVAHMAALHEVLTYGSDHRAALKADLCLVLVAFGTWNTILGP